MSNIVWLSAKANSECIQMSNGLTDVFINILVLSGSRLAQTVDEKRLIVWLAEKDQSKVGMGTVGFDICDMPWNQGYLCGKQSFSFEGDRSGKK